MKLLTTTMAFAFVLATSITASAQFPTASEEHKILKLEEGDWDAEITMFMGPAGPYDPPQKSEGKESNRMIGDFWLVSNFTGSFEGLPFTGHAVMGYDPAKKKYVGTWIDSFSPNAMKMVGKYDKSTKTMTYATTGVEMDGSPSKGKNVIVYGEDERVMTMHAAAPGTDKMIKVMEISYKRAK